MIKLSSVLASLVLMVMIAMVAEEYHRRLEGLGDETLRRIAELKLACHSNEEIRQQLGCSLRSVTLKLELIRKKWQWVKGQYR